MQLHPSHATHKGHRGRLPALDGRNAPQVSSCESSRIPGQYTAVAGDNYNLKQLKIKSNVIQDV